MATDTATFGTRPGGLSRLAAAMGAVPRWAVLLVAALAARALTFGNPLVHVDEEFYLLTAQRMLDGAVPFVDVWDRKPIGLFLLYLPAALFDPRIGIWVYQALALASVVATALLVARLAERAGWQRGALPAALLYVFMLDFTDGQGGQAPVFYNLLMAGAVALIVPRAGEALADRGRAVVALGLIGLALQIKYSVVFEGMFLGLWLLWREHRMGTAPARVLGFGAILVAAAVLPTAAAAGAFAAIGHGDAWLYANFGSILQRQSDPGHVLAKSLFKIAVILTPLLVMCGLASRLPADDRAQAEVRALLFGWLVAAVVGLLLFGGYFNHYALPVMLPAALCCAGFFGDHRIGRRLAWPLIGFALAMGFYITWSARQVRGNGTELEAMAEAFGPGPECIYVYSGSPMLYSYTGRCAASPWLFPSHLARERENGALGVDQLEEIDRIFARRPRFVIMRPWFLGERTASRERMLAHLRQDGYRLKGRYPIGNLTIDLFEAQAAPASTGPSPPRAASSDS